MSPEVFVVLRPNFAVEGRLRISRDGKSVAPECLSPTPSLADLVARERGLVSGVICIAEGTQIADEILSRGISMGADRAIRVPADGGLYEDACISGQRIAAAISSLGGKLVFAGGGTDDGDGEVIPHVIATGLNATCLTCVMELALTDDMVRVERRIEKGHRQIWSARLPAVVAFDPGSEAPRYVPVASDILARQGSPSVAEPDRVEREPVTALSKFVAPRIRPKRIAAAPLNRSVAERMQATVAGGLGETKAGAILSGPPDQVADQIVAFLGDRGLLGEDR